MKPISRRLLPHSVMLRTPTGKDKWQTTTYSTDQELRYVRISPSSKLVTSKDNKQLQLTSVLIYDCVSSTPKEVVFVADQKVVWRGVEYTVISTEPLYDDRKLHHWEVGLI